KGVMLTHRNLIAAVLVWQAVDPVPEDETAVMVFPMFHINGLRTLAINLYAGKTLVLLPRFDLQTLLRLLQDYRATRVVLAPQPSWNSADTRVWPTTTSRGSA